VGIIWPNNKKIIRGTLAGTAPANGAALARQAFPASRRNFFLPVPLLIYMATSYHYDLGKVMALGVLPARHSALAKKKAGQKTRPVHCFSDPKRRGQPFGWPQVSLELKLRNQTAEQAE
jgi:hypothetical protein